MRREGETRSMKKTVATTDALVRKLQRSRFSQVGCNGAVPRRSWVLATD